MNFGEAFEASLGECSKETAFSILDHFYREGGNFIDTANGYHDGKSEKWVGEWMALRGVRDDIVLATKYSNKYTAKLGPDRIHSNYGGNGTKSMKMSLDASLDKLQRHYVDVFYLHWWDYSASIPEVMHALNDLVAAGKVMYLGISDTPAWVVSKANQYARDHALRPFVVYQGMWSAALRDFERDILPMCRDEGMGIAPYGVFNQGCFQTAQSFKEREKHNPGRKFVVVSELDKKVSAVLEKVANTKGVELLHVAMAYVMQKEPYVFPILGNRTLEQLQGSIEGLAVELTAEEISEVESAYTFDPGFPHTFLSGTLFSGERPFGAKGPADVWLTKTVGTFDWVEPLKAVRPYKE